jgi:hypothetical protein
VEVAAGVKRSRPIWLRAPFCSTGRPASAGRSERGAAVGVRWVAMLHFHRHAVGGELRAAAALSGRRPAERPIRLVQLGGKKAVEREPVFCPATQRLALEWVQRG